MLRRVVMVISALLSVSAYGDSFHVAVQWRCDKENDIVAVNYLGAYNEEGRELLGGLGSNGVDPWKLVEVANGRITNETTAQFECALTDGTYLVEIRPSPGNHNLNGSCGGHMSAWVNIRKDSELIFSTGFESGDCHNFELPIKTRVLWRAGASEPEIREVRHEEFYK